MNEREQRVEKKRIEIDTKRLEDGAELVRDVGGKNQRLEFTNDQVLVAQIEMRLSGDKEKRVKELEELIRVAEDNGDQKLVAELQEYLGWEQRRDVDPDNL